MNEFDEPVINIQAYICPWCHNDHNNDYCQTKDVQERVEKLSKKLEWAARIIDSGMDKDLRYDPKAWFADYHHLKPR